MIKQVEKYFTKHPYYNGFVHLLVGVGIGILATYPYVGQHPLRWGAGFIVVGVLGHLYPLIFKNK